MPVGALLVGDHVEEISWRVLRLTQIADTGQAFNKQVNLIFSATTWGFLFLLLVTVAYATVSPHFLEKFHATVEKVFPLLS